MMVGYSSSEQALLCASNSWERWGLVRRTGFRSGVRTLVLTGSGIDEYLVSIAGRESAFCFVHVS
jgi:hypothetical protein